MSRAGAAVMIVLLPTAVEACATCISSPFGDRTYSWPYLLLILLPFVVAAVIGTVLARAFGVRVSTLRRRLTPAFLATPLPTTRHEETT